MSFGTDPQSMRAHASASVGFAFALVVLCLWRPIAAAQDAPRRLGWHDDWPRFRPIGYVATSASVIGAVAVTLFVPYPDEPRWTGGILFDDAIRDALRARASGMRDAIRTASDLTMLASVAHTAILDSAILPIADGSWNTAGQLSLINVQAFALNYLVATLLFKSAARERPLVRDCERNPGSDPLCHSGQYASFPSSHTSTAFTAAGLNCVHHQYLPIYGGPWDTASCVASLALATATGVFRIVGDRHYASDVLVGAAIGFSIGYLYPWLLHYRTSDPDPTRASQAKGGFALTVASPYGLAVGGRF